MKSEIKQTQTFAAKIVKTSMGPNLKIKNQRFYLTELEKFKEGEEVTLTITNKKPKRTDQQNRYLWGVYYPIISKETGEQNIERLHELFKGKFLTTGIVEVLGQKVRMKKSTTELSIGDFSNYITAIAAETGIEPPPTENYNLESLVKGIEMYEKEKKD